MELRLGDVVVAVNNKVGLVVQELKDMFIVHYYQPKLKSGIQALKYTRDGNNVNKDWIIKEVVNVR